MLDDKTQKKLEIYKGALLSVRSQISRAKEGIILDSGRAIPVVDERKLKELEDDEKRIEAEIAKLQNDN